MDYSKEYHTKCGRIANKLKHNLGQKLYELRKEKQMGISEVCALMNGALCIRKIESYELGRGNILFLENLVLLATAFNKKVKIIFEEKRKAE